MNTKSTPHISRMDRFNSGYLVFLKALVNFSDLFMTLVRTVIVTLGIPVALLCVMFVEQNRLFNGITIFERNSEMAGLAAWILVMLNSILEFLVVYEEDKAGYIHPPNIKSSFRSALRRFRYLLWFKEPEGKSPAKRYVTTLSIVTYAILTLALLGSMKEKMSQDMTTAWHQEILHILTSSSLLDFVTWISSLFFAVTLVNSAQSMSNYLAVHTTKVLRGIGETAVRVKEVKERIAEELASPPEIQVIKDHRMAALPSGEWMATCDECGWSKQYASYEIGLRGLTSHKPYCTHVRVKTSLPTTPVMSTNGKH